MIELPFRDGNVVGRLLGAEPPRVDCRQMQSSWLCLEAVFRLELK